MKVWENSKKLWKHSPAGRVPTAFLVLPNFHSCFFNSIETRYMFSISEIFIACVAGVQRGGRGKLNASAKRDRWDPFPTIQLPPSLSFVRRPRRLIYSCQNSWCKLKYFISMQIKRWLLRLTPVKIFTFLN